jgi:prepilin-type N-terminal cleavage/methylation domain-containing protein
MKYNKGFTLVELMIALVISSFVLLGVTSTYSSIQGSIQVSKELENAQEVIRYSAQVFNRSIKQTMLPVIVSANAQTVTVTQPANTRSCFGSIVGVDYQETFTFVSPNLSCSTQDSAGNPLVANTVILTGINNFRAQYNNANELFSFIIEPTVLPQNLIVVGGGAGGANMNGVRIDVALTSRIISINMP